MLKTHDTHAVDSVNTTGRGSIFAIGGRENLAVLEQFVSRCGGPAASLVVVSTASREPDERVGKYDSAFRSLGVEDVSFFHPDCRADASAAELLAALDRADGVFFTGGSQLKLVSTLGGTPVESLLRERHRTGLHLGGTSAGAAAMSAAMIARGRGRSAARLSSVRMSPGFGFIRQVIIDQHFRERDRFGRLLAAVLCNPSMLGFGLDEDTAIALDADDQVSVIGNGTLTIVDGSHLEATDVDEVPNDAPAAFTGMRMHVLTAGWTYDLVDRRCGKQPTPAAPVAANAAKPEPIGDQG